MEIGRILFLTGAFATHAFVGYTLVAGLTDADPRIGLLFGLLPDIDLLFPAGWAWPFVHRGITHTPLFALAVVAGGYAVGRQQPSTIGRRVALAVGLALGSHLAIDSLSPKGIDFLFPLRTSWSPGLAVHSPTATVFLWTASLALLVWDANEQQSL
ncbi:metal-dependent hydrolase [Haloterrigena sp. H1]|uniref:metal-dependent hydrolase n=1 Tax=Haloterrigena sp. H1 TaxID=2552943 RepID=UPI00110DC0F3|nr:metal-dependent hydrolase [Haloterrigena sp. H1]TMT86779.1 metal-dependent hydrolase [Haloterrigena sp. H1]